MSKELTPLEALDRLYRYPDLVHKNPVAYLLEQDNLSTYKDIVETALKRLEKIDNSKIVGTTTVDKALEEFLIKQCPDVEKKLKALNILSEHIIINEKNGYVEFFCGFSLPTNSKYENEEHFKEQIGLLKEALL